MFTQISAAILEMVSCLETSNILKNQKKYRLGLTSKNSAILSLNLLLLKNSIDHQLLNGLLYEKNWDAIL